MQARMKNPGVVIPDAMTAIQALNEAIKHGGVPPRTLAPTARSLTMWGMCTFSGTATTISSR
jgi:hypothetical protein